MANLFGQDAYTTIDAQATYTFDNGFSIGVWGENLTDEPVALGIFQNASSDRISYQAPRSGGGDHIVHYGWQIDDHRQFQDRFPDIFTLLFYAASVTKRVRIVSRIVVVPYRRPFSVAHAFASLDVLSGGRP